MADPIWKDKIITLGTAEAYYYRVRLTNASGAVIYSGKAYRRPNQTNVTVKINDICANYLGQALPVMVAGQFTAQGISKTLYVEASTDGVTYAAGVSVTMYCDWSYDYDFVVANAGLNYPISDDIVKNQSIIISTIQAETVERTYYQANGFVITTPITIGTSSPGNTVFNFGSVANLVKVTIGNRIYNILPECYEYALYYVNAYGGWDTLLIKGQVKMTDRYTRHTQRELYDYAAVSARGVRNFVNEIEKAYEINTGWLTDIGASRMHHLLGSTNVYLYDFADDEMIPVTIEDSECQYKTFKNNGNRMINYAITAVVAKDMMRR